MYNISRFLPRFGNGQTGSSQQLSPAESGDDLLGLQRVMRDAQNPRRPVIGEHSSEPDGFIFDVKTRLVDNATRSITGAYGSTNGIRRRDFASWS